MTNLKGALLGTGMIGEGLSMGTVMGIDGIEEGPGTGWIDGIKEGPGPGMGWKFDVDSVEVDTRLISTSWL
jgi:hypothetical protein